MAEWEELPTETKEGRPIVYVRQAGRTPATGYQVVDPTTGESVGHIGRIEVERREYGGRRGYHAFTFLPPTPEVEVSIRRTEEAKETRELARKEAEFEAKRIREGKIKAEDVVLTQKGAAEELRKILEKEAKEPEVDVREEERQERILATLEKQRQFVALTESQQRTVRTLVKQGREVRFERGAIITEEAGRKVIITPEAIAKVPSTAEVDVKELERLSREIRARREIEVRPILEPEIKREITPEELVRQVELERKGFIRRAVTPAKEFVSRTLRGFKKSVEYAGKPIKTPQESMAIIRDPDVQTFLLVSGLTIVGTAFPAAGKVITTARRVFGAVAVKEFLEEGKPEKLGEALLLLSPEIISAASKVIPKPEIVRGVIGDIRTTLIRFRGGGAARALGIKVGRRAVFVGIGEPPPPIGIVPVTPAGIMPVPPIGIVPVPTAIIPSPFIAPTEIVAERALYITPTAPPKPVIELMEKVIPTQFDIFGKPIPPKPKIKEPITTMIGKDIVVDIVKPEPPITLQRIEVTGAVPVFTQIADVPAKFVEVGKEIQVKLPVEEPKLVVYDPVINRIRLLGRGDIRATGGGFLGEREVFFRDNGKFVEAERFQVIREISPQAAQFRLGTALQPAVTTIDITQQKTILDLFRKEGKKEISLAEARKRLGKKKFDELMGRQIREKKIPIRKRPTRKEIIEARQVLRRPEARLAFTGLLRGAVRVEPVFRRIGERFGFRPLERVTPREIARARITPRELAMRREAGLLPVMVVAPTQVSATRTGLLLGLTPTQEQLKLTEQLKLEEQKIAQEQVKIEEQIKVEESIEIQEQLKVQEQLKIQEQLSIQEQLQVLEQLAVTEQVGITTQIGITAVPTVGVPPPLLLIPPSIPSEEKVTRFVTPPPKEKGYDVYIKRKQLKRKKGSYKSRGYTKANVEPISREAALGLGASETDKYTNRSFFIEKAKQKAERKRQDLVNRWRALRGKFRSSKKKPNVLVEKSAYAIDSREEKEGIPYEAARLRRAGLLQQKITFIKTQVKQKKKQQLQSAIVSKKVEQINFIKSNSKPKKKKGKQIKFL